jgi:hypothetical protein
MTRTELERVLNWANDKLATGAEPPWAWYQYMKLRETLEAILAGIQATSIQTESSPQSEPPSPGGLRLVVSNAQPDSAQRPPLGLTVPLPM